MKNIKFLLSGQFFDHSLHVSELKNGENYDLKKNLTFYFFLCFIL